MSRPIFGSCKAKLKSYCQIEKGITVQSNKFGPFMTKWSPFLQ